MKNKRILALILGAIISFGSIRQTNIQVCAENFPHSGLISIYSMSKQPKRSKIPVLKRLSKENKYIFTSRDRLIFRIIDDNNVSLIYIEKEAENIIIPPQVKISRKIYNVKSIGYNAFENCSNIKFVSLPESIEKIEEGAFKGCTNLQLTKLPESIEKIEEDAFKGCTNLQLTKLPENTTIIGNSAFEGCTNLLLTHLPSNIKTQIEIDKDKDMCGIPQPTESQMKDPYWWRSVTSRLKCYKPGSSVAGIGDYVFKGCTNLQLTELPNGITKIGTSAFEGCINLKLTEIPEGVTTIGAKAFKDSNIEKISLPASVTNLGTSSLKTESLKEITLLNKDSLKAAHIHNATGLHGIIPGSIVINNGIQNDTQNTVAEDVSSSNLRSNDILPSDNSDSLYKDSSDIPPENTNPN